MRAKLQFQALIGILATFISAGEANDFKMFQALIGILATEDDMAVIVHTYAFQALIGILATFPIFVKGQLKKGFKPL